MVEMYLIRFCSLTGGQTTKDNDYILSDFYLKHFYSKDTLHLLLPKIYKCLLKIDKIYDTLHKRIKYIT